MKMGQGLFWGLVFICIGLVLIIKFIFRIDIPVIRLILAIVLIMIGIRMLLGGRWWFNQEPGENEVIFSEKVFYHEDLRFSEYNIIFGGAEFFFTNIDTTLLPREIKINTIFGATKIHLPEDIPVEIKSDAVFSGVSLPGGQRAVFGSAQYQSPGYVSGEPALVLKTDVVFGAVDVLNK